MRASQTSKGHLALGSARRRSHIVEGRGKHPEDAVIGRVLCHECYVPPLTTTHLYSSFTLVSPTFPHPIPLPKSRYTESSLRNPVFFFCMHERDVPQDPRIRRHLFCRCTSTRSPPAAPPPAPGQGTFSRRKLSGAVAQHGGPRAPDCQVLRLAHRRHTNPLS